MMNIAGFPPFSVCRLLLIGLFPRLCVWLLHLSLHVLSPLSVAMFKKLSISLSLSSLSSFHPVSPLSSRPPPPPNLPPPLSLSHTPPLSVPFANCLQSFLFVILSEPRCMKQQSVILQYINENTHGVKNEGFFTKHDEMACSVSTEHDN